MPHKLKFQQISTLAQTVNHKCSCVDIYRDTAHRTLDVVDDHWLKSSLLCYSSEANNNSAPCRMSASCTIRTPLACRHICPWHPITIFPFNSTHTATRKQKPQTLTFPSRPAFPFYRMLHLFLFYYSYLVTNAILVIYAISHAHKYFSMFDSFGSVRYQRANNMMIN